MRCMTDALHRRGPDSEGLATWNNASLGHRRLSILDLSDAGSQPMLSEDGNTGIVFNGCIYNFRDIRAELENLGHRFRSDTDTEVLLLGAQQWGVDQLVQKLRGMFAFALWEDSEQKLTLVRDRLGVKPLVYCQRDGDIAFASTVGALAKAGFAGEIDPVAMLEVLEFGFVSDERCIYQGITKLPPATIAEWQNGRVRQRQYWSLPEPETWARISFDEAVEETERLLLEAVKLRLVSDVPIGVLLSGGVDSGLVCWALQQLNAQVKAFTVRAPGDRSDESADAAATARLLEIEHQIVDMPQHEFSLDRLIDAYSEPFPCSSAQAMLWVSETVKQHAATVLLTGDGGDDVFLGYPFFKDALRMEKIARLMPRGLSDELYSAVGALPDNGALRKLGSAIRYSTGGLGPWIRRHDGLPYYQDHRMLGPKLEPARLGIRDIPASSKSARRLLRDVFEFHRKMHFTSEFMPKVDGATMYYAIESRAPFLDHKIWEFAAVLAPEVRLHGGRLKAILRKIVSKNVSPEIAQRRKSGFNVPVERWLAGRWGTMLAELQDGTELERDGWVASGSLDSTYP